MCNFASFVLTLDREFWLSDSDSHSEIIEHFKLHEMGPHGPNIVKAEISPTSSIEKFDDYEHWKIVFDQDIFPKWHEEESSRQRVLDALICRAKEGFTTVDARGCTALTELKCDAAETVYASGCTALTELKCDAAKYVYASGCTALTELKCDAAKYVDASGCTALTELKCDAAETVYASRCTALKR